VRAESSSELRAEGWLLTEHHFFVSVLSIRHGGFEDAVSETFFLKAHGGEYGTDRLHLPIHLGLDLQVLTSGDALHVVVMVGCRGAATV
jgi:hypothetical protein